jgi:hypothetical protein
MLDFTNYKFRCSSLGKLMTGVKPALTPKQETEMKRLIAKRDVGKITDNQTIELGKYLEQIKQSYELSATVKSELKKIHKQEFLKRRATIETKYMNKGIEVEEKSFTLYSNETGRLFFKNKQRFENEFLTGEPDEVKELIDFKSSWNSETFPLYETEIPETDYDLQLQGYMELTGKSKSKLVYCLIDTPIEIVKSELRTLDRKFLIFDEDRDIKKNKIDLVVEVISKMIYTKKGLENLCLSTSGVIKIDWFSNFYEIPDGYRVKEFHVEKDELKIEALYKQLAKCRIYLNSLSEQISKGMSVQFDPNL